MGPCPRLVLTAVKRRFWSLLPVGFHCLRGGLAATHSSGWRLPDSPHVGFEAHRVVMRLRQVAPMLPPERSECPRSTRAPRDAPVSADTNADYLPDYSSRGTEAPRGDGGVEGTAGRGSSRSCITLRAGAGAAHLRRCVRRRIFLTCVVSTFWNLISQLLTGASVSLKHSRYIGQMWPRQSWDYNLGQKIKLHCAKPAPTRKGDQAV